MVEKITDAKQLENCRADLAKAKTKRDEERASRARSYGILNRKNASSQERIRREKAMCTCGALQRGSVHASECPALLGAKGERR